MYIIIIIIIIIIKIIRNKISNIKQQLFYQTTVILIKMEKNIPEYIIVIIVIY